jgi:hypothetical protein
MARFSGKIGYGEPVETKPGVWEDVITVRNCSGDILRNTQQLPNGDKVNNDITIGNSFSVVVDSYLLAHPFSMRFIKWKGVNWEIRSIDFQGPRVILQPGGVYDGPTGES